MKCFSKIYAFTKVKVKYLIELYISSKCTANINYMKSVSKY